LNGKFAASFASQKVALNWGDKFEISTFQSGETRVSSLGISCKLDLAKRKALPAACSEGNDDALCSKSGIAQGVFVLCIIHFKREGDGEQRGNQLFAANSARESFCRGVL
jgi:hypothetical protein